MLQQPAAGRACSCCMHGGCLHLRLNIALLEVHIFDALLLHIDLFCYTFY